MCAFGGKIKGVTYIRGRGTGKATKVITGAKLGKGRVLQAARLKTHNKRRREEENKIRETWGN